MITARAPGRDNTARLAVRCTTAVFSAGFVCTTRLLLLIPRKVGVECRHTGDASVVEAVSVKMGGKTIVSIVPRSTVVCVTESTENLSFSKDTPTS